MRRRHGNDRDIEPVATDHFLQLFDIEDRHAAARLMADLFVGRVEERGDLESFLTESRVIGERETEVAGAHDRHTQVSIEPEDLTQMAAQLFDVVADTADAEFAEVREILANL